MTGAVDNLFILCPACDEKVRWRRLVARLEAVDATGVDKCLVGECGCDGRRWEMRVSPMPRALDRIPKKTPPRPTPWRSTSRKGRTR